MMKLYSEKLKKLLKSKLVGNYIWVLLGQNIGSVFSMVSLVFTLRLISTYNYGALSIIQTYCSLISDLFGLRTFNGVIKFMTQAESENNYVKSKQYLNTAYLFDIAAGIVGFTFAFILLAPIRILMGWEADTVTYVSWYAPVILFLPILNGAATGVLRKLNYFKQVNILHSIIYAAQFVVLLISWVIGIKSFKYILIVYAMVDISECLGLTFYSFYILQQNDNYKYFWKAGFTFDKSFIKYNFSYGLLLTFDQILGNASTLLINKYIGNIGTAYLKVITRICGLFTKITKPISQVFYPELCNWITEKKYKEAYRISMKYFYIMLCFSFFVILGVYFTYDWWIVIFDADMTTAKIQSILYFVYSMLSVSVICLHQMSFALNMMKYNLWLVGIADLVYLVLLVPLVKNWGVNAYLLLQIVQLLTVYVGKQIYIKKYIKEKVY